MDVSNAFLNGDLKEELYMEQPPGYARDTSLVCRLHRTLYGLKQAPRGWYDRLSAFLLTLEFSRCQSDANLFVRGAGEDIECLAVYVDDMFLMTKRNGDQLASALAKEFKITYEGETQWALGIQFIRLSDGTLCLSQKQYAKDVVERFRMSECNAAPTPINAGINLGPNEGEASESERALYRECVGCLMYLAIGTRPDLAYTVGLLSRFVSNPSELHMAAMKRTLRYLKGTQHYQLAYKGSKGDASKIHAYSDADWAGDVQGRKSTTGWCYLLSGACVSWSSKLQATVAMSTTEAEYVAMSEAVKEGVWMGGILKEMTGLAHHIQLYVDNQGALRLAQNPVFHSRTKHIDVRHHFLRDILERGDVGMEYVPTGEMTADIFTKVLSPSKHRQNVTKLGMESDEQNAKVEKA